MRPEQLGFVAVFFARLLISFAATILPIGVFGPELAAELAGSLVLVRFAINHGELASSTTVGIRGLIAWKDKFISVPFVEP